MQVLLHSIVIFLMIGLIDKRIMTSGATSGDASIQSISDPADAAIEVNAFEVNVAPSRREIRRRRKYYHRKNASHTKVTTTRGTPIEQPVIIHDEQ